MTPFAELFVPDELLAALSNDAWLAALLEAELALVNAEALAGVVPAAAATAVADACDAAHYDVAALARDGRAAGNPVEPLVRAVRERVGSEHAGAVHHGATSQDIVDSAAMLVAREALRLIDADLAAAAGACAQLATAHRGTVLAARTLLQQAVPTTFGLKAAGWQSGIVDARARLAVVGAALPAQLGGAAGTLAALGTRGLEVLRLYATELDLREPVLPWHTNRAPVAELGCALALAAGACAKIARDVTLLAQTEVGEVHERDGGASSTMPHKRNPTAAIPALACERHARANASILLESLTAEHERAAGAWHAEWAALNTALAATGGAAAAVRRSLEGLEVDTERMRANLTAATLSEAERFGLTADDYLHAAEALVDRQARVSGTVVLCGSLGSTAAMWDGQATALAGRRVVRVELPGHGAEPVHDVDAGRLLADVGDGPVTLIGVSFGAALCATVAATYPKRVERLVLACTSPRFGEPAQWHERAATVRTEGLVAIVDAVLERWFTPAFRERERFRAQFLSVDPEGYARCCEAVAGWDGRGLYGRIEAPTLVVAGRDDPTSPPAHAEEIAGAIRDARVEVLEDARHLATVERAAAFNTLLEEFL